MAITAFRQPIWPGDSGRDVRAVKDAMRRMRSQDSGQLNNSNIAGSMFVHCIHCVQRNNGIRSDGIYGKATHAIVAPHFSAADVKLYKAAAIRRHTPPATDMSASEAAKFLLGSDKYHADNPGDLAQLQKAAKGEAVWSPMGKYVHLDKRMLEALVMLIQKGHKIGTYAMCTDHHYDGPNGHSGGKAVDISSIDGVGISSQSAASHKNTLAIAKLLHGTGGTLKPWQLICDGYGYMHSGDIAACTIPNPGFYGAATMAAHRNHIHLGYL